MQRSRGFVLAPQDQVRVQAALDHLLVGAPSLEMGIDWLEQQTGVRAAIGGSHPGLGTWNALASLGPRQYIEIIAPDPKQGDADTFYVPGLRGFKAPRVATWAVTGQGLGARWRETPPANFTCDPPRSGSRVRPDGSRLAWTLAFPKAKEGGDFGGAVPFFIEWEAESPHPGLDAPAGLGLVGLSIGHPEPEALRDALLTLGLDVPVRGSADPAFQVELQTPGGLVIL